MSVTLTGSSVPGAIVLLSFWPPTSSQPWTRTCAGGSIPAAMHIAGHHTQWKRRISLPTRWCTTGHHLATSSSSAAVADGREVVDERVVPDVEDLGSGPTAPRCPTRRLDRVMEMSRRPPLMKESASLRLVGGATASGASAYHCSRRSWKALSWKNQFSSAISMTGRPWIGTAAVDELVLGVVVLAAHAVQAVVRALVDEAVVVDLGQERLDGLAVAVLGRAEEVVVGDVEAGPGLDEPRRGAVGPLLRRHPVLLGSLGDLEAVLVGAREELDLVTAESVPAGDRVGVDRRVRRAQVRRVGDVVDRRRQVEARHRRQRTGATRAPLGSA